jgi:hypothetical protein
MATVRRKVTGDEDDYSNGSGWDDFGDEGDEDNEDDYDVEGDGDDYLGDGRGIGGGRGGNNLSNLSSVEETKKIIIYLE